MLKKLNLSDKFDQFRLVAFLEGITYLLIGFTMILKYKYQILGPNLIVGGLHGFLFVLYCFYLLIFYKSQVWSFKKSVIAFIVSFIPFGTFYAEYKFYNKDI